MRPRNETARDLLSTVLGRQSAVSAAAIAGALGISIPTLHRMLAELGGQVVSTGKARRTRYAMRRPLRGVAAGLPVYEIDSTGQAKRLTTLSLVRPSGSCMPLDASGWPVPEESRDGWWPGLPYPLYDMRPQGYMGRQFARAEHRALGVTADPQEWDDDDIAHVLSRTGSDVSGNLLLGDPAFAAWQALKVRAAEPLKPRAVGPAYARLADEAVSTGVAGSSAAGEFPKFAALRERSGNAAHVLVKFSGADRSATVRRWADLLVAEHLALESAGRLPKVQSARSRIVEHAGRTFLEVERFDRHGLFGRSRLASVTVLDAALVGSGSSNWNLHAAHFAARGLLTPESVDAIAHLWWFGRLIANSDMHGGNLSFRVTDGVLSPAPAYDMLPMHHAPLAGGELPTRGFEPELPLPAHRAVWLTACAAAIGFWTTAAADSRISTGFRRICSAHATQLARLADRV